MRMFREQKEAAAENPQIHGNIVSNAVRQLWIINSINNVCSRNDFAERVELLPILPEQWKAEGDPEEEFRRVCPHLLAVLLGAAVEAVAGWRYHGTGWLKRDSITAWPTRAAGSRSESRPSDLCLAASSAGSTSYRRTLAAKPCRVIR